MESFNDIEKKYQKIPVDYVSDGKKVSGLLSLSKKQSEIILSSEHPLKFEPEESGWFDFCVKAADGKSILFHNALMVDGTRYHYRGDSQQCEEHIFPNVVVIDQANLASGDRVKSLTFQIFGMESFFHYIHVNRCSLHKAPPEDIALIQRLLGNCNQRDTFFDPSDLYLTHHPQQAFRLCHKGNQYEINFSGQFSGGWGSNIRHSYQPAARIIFGEPQLIDDALDAIWSWKRFFSQIAMVDLPVTAIAFYGTEESFGGEASVYLPNMKLDSEPGGDINRIHHGDIPLNFWEDRNCLKDSLLNWLSKDTSRQQFRCLVSWVLKKMEQRFSLDDIVTLCSAIEALEELTPQALPSKEEIKVLVAGAVGAGELAGIDIERDRIQGILNLLRTPSLPIKLKLLMERVSAFVSEEDGKMLIGIILKLRKIAAHGHPLHEETMPLVAPATQALAGICVLFDLLDCGIPLEAHPHTLICPAQRIKAALAAIQKTNSMT